jgi:hypothetical protein
LWCNWKNTITIDELKNIDHENFIKILLIEIQKRYVSPKDPLDFLYSLEKFIFDINIEIKTLTFYSKFYNFLNKTKIIKTISLDTKNLLKIDKMIERLLFIREKFLTWIATYKIEKNNVLK